jgi:serine/threonine protein kinase
VKIAWYCFRSPHEFDILKERNSMTSFPDEAPTEATPGLLLAGRYELLSRLGAGGYGRVWLAEDTRLGVRVAVKELSVPAGVTAAETAERVERAVGEARNAAQLRDHPNIVTVHDAFIERGRPWTIMQYIPGLSLAEEISRSGPLSTARVATTARAIFAALGACHAAGIVHRDVKPANIMLGENGIVMLTDFGIAKRAGQTSMTAKDTVIGSVEFMAPERIRGQPATAASDLFSLGVTLYYAVEGISPFSRDSGMASLSAVLLDEIPVSARAGGLAPLIEWLTRKDPTARPSLEEAQRLLDDEGKSPWAEMRVVRSQATTQTWPSQILSQETTRPRPHFGRRIALLAAAILATASVVIDKVVADSGTTHAHTLTTMTTPPHSSPPTPSPALVRTPSASPSSPAASPSLAASPSFNPVSLDSENTDQTPLTVGSLFPQTFNSTDGTFTKTDGGSTSCPADEGGNVKTVLIQYGCTRQIDATYLDQSNQIEVSAWVIPLSDSQTATATYNAISSNWSSPSWGLLCPSSGPGSNLCQNHPSWSSATQGGWIGVCHRYMMAATANYVDLRTDSSVASELTTITEAAGGVIGPENIAGGKCW